ncbi:bifunctional nicotinamidase/pyrazinamidase [Sphingobacterium sp. LRF_L2]|uniref:bifunctional nicotinamidase/pyrazinamidase n=1 Tax=Sphingobacterium sp. LRF_L2 TaxID=3369421 RepID=UPI003F63BECC
MKALIIVDIQNDFLPTGALPVPDGDTIIPKINQIQSGYELVIATQDWHPEGHKSFASQHADHKLFDQIIVNGLNQTLWPDHCIQESEGAALSVSLDTKRIEAVFRKGTDVEIDSYSGFFDNGHQKSTGLAGYLKDKNVTEVHVCGLAAEFCVYYTAMDSLQQGFSTAILTTLTKAIDDAVFEKKKTIFQQAGGVLLSNP